MEKFDAQKFMFGERRFVNHTSDEKIYYSEKASGDKKEPSLAERYTPDTIIKDRDKTEAEDKKSVFELEAKKDKNYQESVKKRTDIEKKLVDNLRESKEYENLLKIPEKMGQAFDGVSFNSDVPKDLNFVGDSAAIEALIAKSHEVLKLKMKAPKEDDENKAPLIDERYTDKSMLALKSAEGDIAKVLKAENSNVGNWEAYDVLVCLNAFRMLSEAQKQFKEKYPGMENVQAFKDAKDVKYSVKIEGGKVKVDEFTGITEEMKNAARVEAEKNEALEAQKAAEEKAKSPEAIKTKYNQVKNSFIGKLMGFFWAKDVELDADGKPVIDEKTGLPKDKFLAIAKGEGEGVWFWQMLAGVGDSGKEGYFKDFVDALKVIPIIGGPMAAGLEKLEEGVKKMASNMNGKTMETVEAITFDQFVASASKFDGWTLEKDSKLDGDFTKEALKKKKYAGVEVKIEKDKRIAFPSAVSASEIFVVADNGTESAKGSSGTVTELTEAGTYRLKCDLKKDTIFPTGAVVSMVMETSTKVA